MRSEEDYVSSVKIDHFDSPWNGRHKFDFFIDVRLGEVISSIDDSATYKMEFHFESQYRWVKGIEPWAGEQSSLSAGAFASETDIRRAVDKLLTYEFKGYQLDSLAVNGKVKFRFRAAWGEPGDELCH